MTYLTEREKMLSGQLYNAANDTELEQKRLRCKDLCFEFNALTPSALHQQSEIMQKILGKITGQVYITAPFYCDYGENIRVGANFYANHHLTILDCANVTIGDNVLIGPNCCIATACHPLDITQRIQGLEFARPVTIGHNVWIGANVVILPGVTIGDGAVIGAGSVVNKTIPPAVIAVGNPCRVLRAISPDDRCPQDLP